MAKMVNIFGKLFTLLRRPQPGDEDSVVQGPEVNKDAQKNTLTDSTASADWEHVQVNTNGAVADTQASLGDAQDSIDTNTYDDCSIEIKQHSFLSGSVDCGTDLDLAYTAGKYVKQVSNTDTCCPDETPDKTETKLIGSETMDLEALNKLVEEIRSANSDMSGKQVSITSPKHVNTPDATIQTESAGTVTGDKVTEQIPENNGNAESMKKEQTKEDKKIKVCQYFRRGKKCFKKDKCPFAHIKGDNNDGERGTPVKEKQKPVNEKDFTNYMDYVGEATAHNTQINPKDLLYKLGYVKDTSQEAIGAAVVGQYKLAVSRGHWYWVKDARYFAELFFPGYWIDENLPHKVVKSGRKNRPKQKKEKYNVNADFEKPGSMCRDFRLAANPDIQIITANAAINAGGDRNGKVSSDIPDSEINGQGDGKDLKCKPDTSSEDIKKSLGSINKQLDEFVTDYTASVIQEAMKVAIGDGLSESVIMEVIEDVACLNINTDTTPRKSRGRVTKVDVTRTPHARPEQLAMGFNYTSDVVVKQSPKTVNGQIFCLDTLSTPRERTEQLAVGFNYMSDQLVKDTPKSATGEILIPGVVLTPRKRARDQLAVGFNYHSDLIAQEALTVGDTVMDNAAHQQKEASSHLSNGLHPIEIMTNNNNDINMQMEKRSRKKSVNDMFAIGFSYNSDLVMTQSLDEINGNILNGVEVVNLMQEASMDEDRNIIEITDPVVLPPAGSVW